MNDACKIWGNSSSICSGGMAWVAVQFLVWGTSIKEDHDTCGEGSGKIRETKWMFK